MQLDLVSVHFAKAGGTSLARALWEHYGDAIHWEHGRDPCNPACDLSRPVSLPPDVTAVHGHFRPDCFAVYSTRVLATFLRHPVDSLISAYYFWLGLPPSDNPDHIRFLTDLPTVEEYARQSAGRAYSAYFGRFDMRDFDFIGFHDRRAYDLMKLSDMLGFRVRSDVRLNVGSPSPEREALNSDRDRMAELHRILSDDLDFYESVRSQRLGEARAR